MLLGWESGAVEQKQMFLHFVLSNTGNIYLSQKKYRYHLTTEWVKPKSNLTVCVHYSRNACLYINQLPARNNLLIMIDIRLKTDSIHCSLICAVVLNTCFQCLDSSHVTKWSGSYCSRCCNITKVGSERHQSSDIQRLWHRCELHLLSSLHISYIDNVAKDYSILVFSCWRIPCNRKSSCTVGLSCNI